MFYSQFQPAREIQEITEIPISHEEESQVKALQQTIADLKTSISHLEEQLVFKESVIEN